MGNCSLSPSRRRNHFCSWRTNPCEIRDIVAQICFWSLSDPKTMAALAQVNKTWRDIACSEKFWRLRYDAIYGHHLTPEAILSWGTEYQVRFKFYQSKRNQVLQSRKWNGFFTRVSNKKTEILVTGLEGSGKTSLLSCIIGLDDLKEEKVGFRVLFRECKEFNIFSWDIGPQYDDIISNWHSIYIKSYFGRIQALLWIMDSSNLSDVISSCKKLKDILIQDLHLRMETIVLILANKQDLPNALPLSDISQYLPQCLKDRVWILKGCSIQDPRSVKEAIQWMCSAVQNYYCPTEALWDVEFPEFPF